MGTKAGQPNQTTQIRKSENWLKKALAWRRIENAASIKFEVRMHMLDTGMTNIKNRRWYPPANKREKSNLEVNMNRIQQKKKTNDLNN